MGLHPAVTRFSIQAPIRNAQPTPRQAEQPYPEIVELLREFGMELVNPNVGDEFGRCTRKVPGLLADKQ